MWSALSSLRAANSSHLHNLNHFSANGFLKRNFSVSHISKTFSPLKSTNNPSFQTFAQNRAKVGFIQSKLFSNSTRLQRDESNSQNASKPPTLTKEDQAAEAKRLLAIAKPEWRLFLAALGALAAGTAASLVLPVSMGVIIDTITNSNPKWSLEMVVAVMTGVFAVSTVTTFVRYSTLNIACERIVKKLRKNLFTNLLKQEVAFFDSNKTGELINRLSSDIAIMGRTLTYNFSFGIRSLVEGIGGIGMLFYIAPKLTLVMLAIVPPITVGAIFYGRIVKRLSKEIQNTLASTTAIAEERIANIRTVKSFAQEMKEIGLYEREVDNLYQLAKRSIFASATFFSGVHFAGSAALLAILAVGGSMVQSSAMSIGELTSFLLYSVYIVASIGSLSSFYGDVMTALGASSRVFQLVDRIPLEKQVEFNESNNLPQLSGDITLDNIHFSYPARPESLVLEDVSINVPEGQVLAIVGHSGSGKSTVSALLSRFYEPQKGKILIGGVDISTMDTQWLRNQIGLVSQDVVLFRGTIFENIVYGCPSKSQQEVEEAAKMANAHDFIMGFPEGYQTSVGARGVTLSGGQAQRIAIARAILKDPKILILDEATSALDAESEFLVQQALERVMVGRTVIVIAHRLSTIRHASKICVIHKGKVAESGTFDNLMQKPNGIFKQLVHLQTRELAK